MVLLKIKMVDDYLINYKKKLLIWYSDESVKNSVSI